MVILNAATSFVSIYPSGMEGKTVFPTSTTDDVTSLNSWIKPLQDTAINCTTSTFFNALDAIPKL